VGLRAKRPRFLGRRKAEAAEAASPPLGRAHERSAWFWAHYKDAADDTIRVLAEAGIELRGKRVADVGCGEGITDLALTLKARPSELVGYDVNDTDVPRLLEEARREGVAEELPPELRFEISAPASLPCHAATFDVIVSWSAFEHVGDPPALMREISRALRDDGCFMLQLWPFFHSQHGSHLWQWFPEGFAQFSHDEAEIERRLRADGSDPAFAEMMLREFRNLNGATLDDLGDAIRGAGMRVARLEPISGPVNIPAGAADVPLSRVAISGVMLLAVKD
jgi:SAM-dependent methyltransferase